MDWLFNWLQAAGAAAQAGWLAIGQRIAMGEAFFGAALQQGLAWVLQTAKVMVDQLAAELAPEIQAVQAVQSATGTLIFQVHEQVLYVEQEAFQLVGATSERARQYFLARLAANPLGVLSEGATVVYKAGGIPSFPDPNQAAPWGAVSALAAEMNAYRTDPGHAVRASVDGFVADLAAVRKGSPPALAAYALHPEDVPGYTPEPPPAGADPDAREKLTDEDLRLVTSTTS